MKVTDRVRQANGATVVICDVSPPRAGGLSYLEPMRNLDADYISVAYNPGKAVRADSALMACWLKHMAGKDVVVNLATRDMNKLAIQSHLLGAQLMGLDNLVVVAGDPFNEKELSMVSDVRDFKPTELMESIVAMNQGTDYKGSNLRQPTDFCIGATIDLARGVEREARLTHHKVKAGAHFLITQPVFHPREVEEFHMGYRAVSGTDLTQPVFWGVYILQKDAVMFGNIPDGTREEVEKGRPGTEIALELLRELRDSGINTIYLMPPILRSGARNYEAAQEFLVAACRM